MLLRCVGALTLVVPASVQAQQSLSEFQIIDSRPIEDVKARYLSTSVFSCDYFIRALNDEGRTRNRMQALAQALQTRFGNSLAGHRLNVTAYRLYFNEAASQMSVAMASAAGSVGGTSTGAGRATPKCEQAETPHGWFDPAETTNGNPPLVIEFAATLDDRPIAFRSVYSPAEALSTIGTFTTSKAKKNLYDKKAAPQVDAAIDKANDRAAGALEEILGR